MGRRIVSIVVIAILSTFLWRNADAAPAGNTHNSVSGDILPTLRANAASRNPIRPDTVILCSDTLPVLPETILLEEKNKRLYDTLKMKADRNFFSRMLYNLLVVPTSSGPSNRLPMNIVDETQQYSAYQGMRINSINITTNNVFLKPVSYLEKAANAVHVTTRERTIRRDLLFRKGDKVDPMVIVMNKQLFLSRSYVYNIEILMQPSPDDSSAVDVKIITHDSWTIGAAVDATGLTGRASAEIYDANLLGTGDKLKYRLSVDWLDWKYRGSQFEYGIPNLFGTFFQADFIAGRSFKESRYGGTVNKKFIRNSDYEIGVEYFDATSNYYILYVNDNMKDFSEQVKYRYWDLWTGKSFYIPAIESSIYGMARYYDVDFSKTPDFLYVGRGFNPAFHDHKLYLGSLGFYRERFLTTNLIYGFGFSEYIATGFRAEVTGGYMDGIYEKGVYGGLSFMGGDFIPIGYLSGKFSIGSFFDPSSGIAFRSAINVGAKYFTNLEGVGTGFYKRHFLSLDYVKGWNREVGVDEWIRLTRSSGPRDIIIYTHGRERVTLSHETVIFTPWQPLGFRMAMYGFADLALIGDNRFVFNNPFYATLGVGVRMKNEMLIFGALQLNLCISFGKGGLQRNDWLTLDNERRMERMRYMPTKPVIVDFK